MSPNSQTVVVNLPLFSDPETVVLVFDPEDRGVSETGIEIYDECPSLESAMQYAHDGYICVAVNPEYWWYATNSDEPEVRLTVAQVQEALDHEQRLVQDCFGRVIFS